MIKFEHTIFALPFAFIAALAAAQGLPPLRTMLWILVAMVGARTAAMTFNRLVDEPIDADNPRTRDRALPAGRVSRRGGLAAAGQRHRSSSASPRACWGPCPGGSRPWPWWSCWATPSASASPTGPTSCWASPWPARPWAPGSP